MRKIVVLATVCSLFATSAFAFDPKELAKRNSMGYKYEGEKLEYKIPDESTIPNNQMGDMIRYGKELIVHTYKYIGPEVDDKKMRYSGNNFSCQTCHLDAGTKAFSAPFIGTSAAFPQYRPREDTIGTLAERINGCMQRSMNGKPLPVESKEMKAMEAYTFWLSQGVPIGASNKLEGRGLHKIDRKMIKKQAADPVKGKVVYTQHCASCHGEDGLGVKNEGKANGYMFPPLWGPDSYNKGAGMYRTLKAADFIRSNMPLGATKEHPILTDEEAYNVAAYMNLDTHERPEKPNRDKDFPSAAVKAPDAYIEGKDPIERKIGPYGNIIK
ncbi:c-type cytochrome [Aliarcobacter skirrowii]|uniref:c-type cytochrome n=1 Tax=Aliarcobacter skirrowii TaxID=28200 RepID=UPI0021B25F3F|nr:c-type cytochrome [Aliarcobacter skirrowii]MCT7447058.1 c-type cytochrome [Aliarcobacter skirrowii]MDX4026132.1 c-type cytochrome [Aliarcobacter skirrowii]MDX4050921.1 c-type cytochrome [Aliarcobacter skirrowii]MDX4058145.1 c-type cytochrome [Aliarcobacter skirrowii]MDX4066041.1 c-type cytochrome [Aliarcobacter skirrowii]